MEALAWASRIREENGYAHTRVTRLIPYHEVREAVSIEIGAGNSPRIRGGSRGSSGIQVIMRRHKSAVSKTGEQHQAFPLAANSAGNENVGPAVRVEVSHHRRRPQVSPGGVSHRCGRKGSIFVAQQNVDVHRVKISHDSV